MFDEQPDGDPHTECAAEIKSLQKQVRALAKACERLIAPALGGKMIWSRQRDIRWAMRILRVLRGK